jgi:hypothetical protein
MIPWVLRRLAICALVVAQGKVSVLSGSSEESIETAPSDRKWLSRVYVFESSDSLLITARFSCATLGLTRTLSNLYATDDAPLLLTERVSLTAAMVNNVSLPLFEDIAIPLTATARMNDSAITIRFLPGNFYSSIEISLFRVTEPEPEKPTTGAFEATRLLRSDASVQYTGPLDFVADGLSIAMGAHVGLVLFRPELDISQQTVWQAGLLHVFVVALGASGSTSQSLAVCGGGFRAIVAPATAPGGPGTMEVSVSLPCTQHFTPATVAAGAGDCDPSQTVFHDMQAVLKWGSGSPAVTTLKISGLLGKACSLMDWDTLGDNTLSLEPSLQELEDTWLVFGLGAPAANLHGALHIEVGSALDISGANPQAVSAPSLQGEVTVSSREDRVASFPFTGLLNNRAYAFEVAAAGFRASFNVPDTPQARVPMRRRAASSRAAYELPSGESAESVALCFGAGEGARDLRQASSIGCSTTDEFENSLFEKPMPGQAADVCACLGRGGVCTQQSTQAASTCGDPFSAAICLRPGVSCGGPTKLQRQRRRALHVYGYKSLTGEMHVSAEYQSWAPSKADPATWQNTGFQFASTVVEGVAPGSVTVGLDTVITPPLDLGADSGRSSLQCGSASQATQSAKA